MKAYLVLIGSLVFYLHTYTYAQKEANIWYFGDKAGLDFSSGTAVPIEDVVHNIPWGVATICDTLGNLLFYTDGITVWNKNNEPMPNGQGLLGHDLAIQTIIVPSVCEENQYYIFSLDGISGASHFPNGGGFFYSIVDVGLNGGLGDVIVKNERLFSVVNQAVAAVKHSNGRDTWVVTHEYDTDRFVAYLVSPAGITGPVFSSVGSSYARVPNNLKISPQGDKIAFTPLEFNFSTRITEVFDFDASTGVVSNMVSLDNRFSGMYEFSPNGQYLYLRDDNYDSFDTYLLQYDLLAGSPSAIRNSVDTIEKFDFFSLGGDFQLGLDGKIYIGSGSSLSVINDPNIAGVGCDFEFQSIDLPAGVTGSILPDFISSYFDANYVSPLPLVPITADFIAETVCVDSLATFIDSADGLIDLWEWSVDNNIIDSFYMPNNTFNYLFSDSDPHTIKLKVSNVCVADSLSLEIMADTPLNITTSPIDTSICGATEITLDYPVGVEYEWISHGVNIPLTVDENGIYLLNVFNSCSKDTIEYTITTECSFFIPNAFTPNNDGVNDLFSPSVLSLDYQLFIYSRLGEEIFVTSESQPWDGKHLGIDCPDGVYTYSAIINGSSFSGNVLLTR